MRRWFKGLAIGVAAICLLVVAVMFLALGTQSGGRWVLGQVPGLSLEGFEGRLGGQWRAASVQWQQPGQNVELRNVAMDWRPACLWRLTLCLDKLHVDSVDLAFAPSAEKPADDTAFSLPQLKLPIGLQLGDIQVGRITLDGTDQVQDLRLAAHWTAQGLRLDSVHARRDDLALDLQGTLDPVGNWPLKASAQLQLPAVAAQGWQLDLAVEGELLETLKLSGQSSGYLPATLEGEVRPLAENLPARLRINSEAFRPSADLPTTLTLEQLELTAQGDLAAGYEITGQTRFPAEQGPIPLALQGKVTAKGANIAALDLTASPSEQLKLAGELDWSEGLSADARLNWANFPWQRLYPMEPAPQVVLKTLAAEVHYRDGRYLGNFDGALEGPAGPFTVASPFSGDLQQVNLPQLAINVGKGKVAGHLNLKFADGIAWDTALDLSAFDPSYWVAQLPGQLAGPLRSQGEMKNGRLSLDADLDITGRLRGQKAMIKAQASGAGERWSLKALDVLLGDNRIQGSGSAAERIEGRLDLALPRLGQLWPGLQGRLNGRVDLAGTMQAPQGQMKLQGQQLAFEDNRVQSLDLAGQLSAAQKGALDLKAQGIRVGDTALGTFTAKGNGDIRQQSLALDLSGPQLKLALGFDGTLDKGNWKGRVGSGTIEAGGQAWRLQAPARLQRLASGEVDLGAHCWRSGDASLCGDEQRLMPEPKIRYHLKQFPIESLAQWMPKDFGWQGRLNGDITLDLPSAGPKGQVVIDASGGTFKVRDQAQWVELPYRTLQLDSRLTPSRVDTRLDFSGDKLGQLQLQAQINPIPASKPLTGTFSLAGLDLSVARPFVPMLDTLAGKLDGNGQLSGSLLAPQVNGLVTLEGGEATGAELPVSFEALHMRALIAGQGVQLSGGWKSGPRGEATLDGRIDWANALAVELALRGNQLPISVEPYATLDATPDLKLSVNGEKVAVSGTVKIPKGDIVVRELPPSTVKVSDDAVIVGNQTEEGKPAMAVAMDVNVEVGQDKLTFTGFGLNANIAGHLHIGDNMDTRGELNLNEGRYRAYGQRLTIRRARVLFAGPIDQPYLDIEAIRKTDDVVAGIRLSGSIEQPTTEVFSEPAMSQEQALSYLVLGRPLSTTGEDNNMVAQAALGLGLMGTSSVTEGLAKNLGIQDFQLDTEGSGDATSVVASGNLSEKLSLRYGVGVFEPANTIALRYLLSKRVYLEAASGLASSLDIFYKRDF